MMSGYLKNLITAGACIVGGTAAVSGFMALSYKENSHFADKAYRCDVERRPNVYNPFATVIRVDFTSQNGTRVTGIVDDNNLVVLNEHGRPAASIGDMKLAVQCAVNAIDSKNKANKMEE